MTRVIAIFGIVACSLAQRCQAGPFTAPTKEPVKGDQLGDLIASTMRAWEGNAKVNVKIRVRSSEHRKEVDVKPILLEEDIPDMKELSPKFLEIGHSRGWNTSQISQAACTAWWHVRFEAGKLRTTQREPLLRFDVGSSVPPREAMAFVERFPTAAVLQAFQTVAYVVIESQPGGADIEVIGQPGWKKTRDDGYLAPGNYTIKLSKPGYQRSFNSVTVVTAQTNTFQFTLSP